jgi:hypothetical protein
MLCKRCGENVEPFFTLMESGPNYAKNTCPLCDCFLGWVKKPENEKRRTRGSKYKPHSLGKEYCELCRRKRGQLGKRGTLHIHHKDCDYTNDVPENLLVLCTSCHELVHLHKKTVNGEYGNMFTDETMTEVNLL